MAKITEHERPTTISTVDSRTLMSEEDVPSVDDATGAPSALRAFVVVRNPRVTVIPHLFSESECDHLLGLVDGCWVPSLVGEATGSSDDQYASGDLQNTLSKTRTSWSCMLRYSQTSIVERLEHRLSSVAGLPLDNLERMNMVRYAPGELFDEHHDGKFRPRTIFVYLNELPEDNEQGDTFFPVLGLAFKPRRGTAVMWSNVAETGAEDVEDSRMLHAGRAPTVGIKYGVNCFFNVNKMRLITEVPLDVSPSEAVGVDAGTLGTRSSSSTPASASSSSCVRSRQAVSDAALQSVPTAYCLCRDPQLVCVPRLLSEMEVEHIICLIPGSGSASERLALATSYPPFAGETRTLRTLEAAETPVIEEIEKRLAGVSGLPLGHLARLRVVDPGHNASLRNRGCGPKTAYICLSEDEEVVFTKLGINIALGRGDALLWQNVDWSTDAAVEDIRTLHLHLGSDALGLDAFFHDNPVRQQQGLRSFVPDSACSATCSAGGA